MPTYETRIFTKAAIGIMRMVGSAAYYFALALIVGPSSFGVFAAIAAVLAVLNPLVDMGAATVVTRDLVRGRDVHEVVRENVVAWIFSAGVLLFIAVPATRISLPSVETHVALGLVLGNVLLVRPLAVAASTLNALGPLNRYLGFELAVIAARGLAIVALVSFPPTLASTSLIHGLLGVAVSLMAWKAVRADFGGLELRAGKAAKTIWRGASYALGLASQAGVAEADKVSLALVVDNAGVGTYAFGARLVTLASMPISGMLAARYPVNFVEDRERVVQHAGRFLLRGGGIGLLTAIAIWTLGDVIVTVVAPQYIQALEPLRVLALVPLLQAASLSGGDVLTGSGMQSLRTIVQAVAALLCFVLSLALIQALGQVGAAWARLASEAAISVVTWLLVLQRAKA